MSPNQYSFAARLIVLTVAFYLSSRGLSFTVSYTSLTSVVRSRFKVDGVRGISMSTRYEQMLKEAQAAKLKGGQQQSASQPRQAQQQQQQQQQHQRQQGVIDVEEEIVEEDEEEEEEEGDSGLPFSDKLYDDLKFVISKISARMKSESAMSKDELDRFKKSVDSIIKDSKKGSNSVPSSNLPRMTNFDDEEEAPEVDYDLSEGIAESGTSRGAGTPFGAFHGSVSTWDIPNSDNMNTQEFYAAVNKRIANVKQTLRTTIGTDYNPANNYEETLNSMNRNKR